MSVNTFSGSKPNLINHALIKDIETKINVPFDDDTVVEGMAGFYRRYIQPNLLAIIVISLFILYLVIKYIIKHDEEEKMENVENILKDKKKAKSKTKKRLSQMDIALYMAKQRELQKKTIDAYISDHISDDYLIGENESDEKKNKDKNKDANNDNDNDEQDDNERDIDDNHVKIGDGDPSGIFNPVDNRNADGMYNLDGAAKMMFNE